MFNRSTGTSCDKRARPRLRVAWIILAVLLSACTGEEDSQPHALADQEPAAAEQASSETAAIVDEAAADDLSHAEEAEGEDTSGDEPVEQLPTYVTIGRDEYFGGMNAHDVFVFDDRVWAYGYAGTEEGSEIVSHLDRLWVSEDGIRFEEVVSEEFIDAVSREVVDDRTDGSMRLSFIEFGGSLYGFGAYFERGEEDELVLKHAMLTTQDGTTWSDVDVVPPFEPRSTPLLATFENQLLSFGSRSPSGTNVVWRTSDLATWTPIPELETTTSFGGRYNRVAVVDDSIVFVQRPISSDIPGAVHISDGTGWTEVELDEETERAMLGGDVGLFHPATRRDFSLVAHNEYLYLLGGTGFSTPRYFTQMLGDVFVGPFIIGFGEPEHDVPFFTYNDVWRSPDGVTWEQIARPREASDLPWDDRALFDENFRSTYDTYQNYGEVHAVSFRGRIYLYTVPGYGGIWTSEDGIEWEKIAQIEGPGRPPFPDGPVSDEG